MVFAPGLEVDRSDLDPGDETKIGLAVLGDVDQVDGTLEIDRGPVAAIELVIELWIADGIGANPERIGSGLGGVELRNRRGLPAGRSWR